MGWLMAYDRSYGRKELIADLRKPSRFGPQTTLLQSSAVGNHFWYLAQTGAEVWIGLDLMQGGGKEGGWGHKDMCESMGPCYYDCPITYLDKATDPKGYAIEWRAEVRRRHTERRAKGKPVKGMVVSYGDHEYELQSSAGPRKGWNVYRVSDGAWFRMRAHQLSRAVLAQKPQLELEMGD